MKGHYNNSESNLTDEVKLLISAITKMALNLKYDIRAMYIRFRLATRGKKRITGGVIPDMKRPHVSSNEVHTAGPGPALHFGSSTCFYHTFFNLIKPGL
jgi:hypothetical protein